MDKIERRKRLERIAKSNAFRGKKSRKELEKYLLKLKKDYAKTSSDLKDYVAQLEKLNNLVELNSAKEKELRAEMRGVHEIIRNMDFTNSSDVKINDIEDVAYMIDGKTYSYDADNNELSKYEKKKKVKEDEQCAIDLDNEDIPEGLDINIGGI